MEKRKKWKNTNFSPSTSEHRRNFIENVINISTKKPVEATAENKSVVKHVENASATTPDSTEKQLLLYGTKNRDNEVNGGLISKRGIIFDLLA